MNETIKIGSINGSELTAIKTEDGTVLVPIKPICTALGIDIDSQRQKIQEDEDLNSVAVLSTATGADGKHYEMFCLPEEFIYGWLFTINPKNVAASARESVRKYRRKCYAILYSHFHGRSRRQQELIEKQQKAYARVKLFDDRLQENEAQKKDLKAERAKAVSELEKIREAFDDDQPSLFD